MFFYITLHSIKPHKLEDNPHDLFDKSAELYQTWALAALDDATDMSSAASWGRQGFSLRAAPGGATSIRKPKSGDPLRRVRVIDPQITFGLPDEASEYLYRFDAHYWESDNGNATKKVRALFTDRTLKYMDNAWKAASADRDKAIKQLLNWLDDNWQSVVTGLVAAGSPAAAGVITQYNVLDLLEAIVRVAVNGADDYHQHHRYVFQIQKSPELRWRVVTPSGANGQEWKTGFGTQKVIERVRADGGDTLYDVEWRFRLLES